MRACERRMLELIHRRRSGLAGGNTRVVTDGHGRTVVYLHGNPIIEVIPCEDGHHAVIRDCGWQSHTTKSRLNAFLRGYATLIHQRDFKWYRGDEPWRGEADLGRWNP